MLSGFTSRPPASRFIGLVLFLLAIVVAKGRADQPAGEGAGSTPGHPNIVLILVDDLGWRDLGPYGQDFARTPRIDELAGHGVVFTSAYASCPVCSPTRAALLTGLCPPRVGITDWIPGAQFPTAKLACPVDLDQLPLEQNTLAERLRPGGYRSYHVGKWHLGGEGFLPTDQGFDVNIMGSHTGHPATYFWPYGNATGTEPAHSHAVRPLPPGGTAGEYLTDRQGDEAVRSIEEAASRRRPFFLYLPFYAVHLPLEAPSGDVERLQAQKQARGLDGAKPRPVYAAMVESVDRNVGRVIDALRRASVFNDTLVILTSDNGGEESATDNRPLRGAKGTLYEGGVRVPLIIKWPGLDGGGRRVDTPTITPDLFATACDASGLGVPAGLDGETLGPLMRNETSAPPARTLAWHYPHYHTAKRPPCGAIRDGDWKLIEFFEDGRAELYQLRDDPGEAHDLAGAQPQRAAELRAKLVAWRTSVGAKMPTPNAAAAADGSP